MISDNKSYFIDYQGGRKGALQYDIASLLYDAKANLPNSIRTQLLNYYIDQLHLYIFDVDKNKFIEHYYGYVLIRIMQAMGAYGFRGFYENKTHFLQSIPYAIQNIQDILNTIELPVKIPTLLNVLQQICNSEILKNLGQKPKLKVSINSFSYKKSLPVDQSGNGGGFVFDCRALPNPGRYIEYKSSTGRDSNVISFLENEQEVHQFIHNVYNIVSQSVNRYIERDFSNLMINFGCTGGQHRSVYCAEKISEMLNNNFDINIELNHIEQTQLNNQ